MPPLRGLRLSKASFSSDLGGGKGVHETKATLKRAEKGKTRQRMRGNETTLDIEETGGNGCELLFCSDLISGCETTPKSRYKAVKSAGRGLVRSRRRWLSSFLLMIS